MLSLALTKALSGVDISRRYPQFYHQLLADAELRQEFLDGLCLLDGSLNRLEALPGPASRDLQFLARTTHPEPVIVVQDEWSWRLV